MALFFRVHIQDKDKKMLLEEVDHFHIKCPQCEAAIKYRGTSGKKKGICECSCGVSVFGPLQ